MLVMRAYRYEMDPNNAQRSSLLQHAGVARFAYNWGLAHRIQIYETNTGNDRFTDAMKQYKLLISLKKTQYTWMYEVSKCAPQEALRDLHRAFQNFYRGLKTDQKVGFPKFKRKGVKDSFRLYGTIKFTGWKIQLPRIGKIRLKEKRKKYFKGRILSATVRRRADRWFVSITVEEKIPDPKPNTAPPVGVDLGIKTLATLSNGRTVGVQVQETFGGPQLSFGVSQSWSEPDVSITDTSSHYEEYTKWSETFTGPNYFWYPLVIAPCDASIYSYESYRASRWDQSASDNSGEWKQNIKTTVKYNDNFVWHGFYITYSTFYHYYSDANWIWKK